MNDYRDYLCHHGVKGQKWGIRRYQNKDGTLTEAGKIHYRDNDYVIEKDFRLNSVVGAKKFITLNKKLDKKHMPKTISTYDPDNEHDKMVYEGPFAMYNSNIGNKFIYANEYKTVNELRSPGDEKRVDLFVESYKNNKQDYDAALTKTSRAIKRMSFFSKPVREKYKEALDYSTNLSDEQLRDIGYKTMMAANFRKRYDPKAKKIYNEYYDLVKSKGYNSIVDDSQQKVYNDAVMPLIVFDTDKNLSIIGNKKLNAKEADKLVKKAKQYNFEKTGKYTISLN